MKTIKLIFITLSIAFAMIYFSSCNEKTKKISEDNMILVEGGTFVMGCTAEQDSSCYDCEKPQHEVTLKSFYIGKFEVSVGDFKKFIDATNYQTDADKTGSSYYLEGKERKEKEKVNWQYDERGNIRDESSLDYPVIHVSWNDAQAYCDWLSQETGNKYRLPSEAEWEYAARGGKNTKSFKYSGSNKIDEVAWYKVNNESKIHKVGQLAANELGLYDMSGNAWEWCNDIYCKYDSDPTSDSYRTLRGGNWDSYARTCRVSSRDYVSPSDRSYFIGFRVVKEAEENAK